MSTAAARKWFEAVASLEYCVLCKRHGVQVSHSNMFRGKSQKSDAHNCAALCPQCHHAIDNGSDLSQLERRELHNRAIVLTHDALIRRGRLVLK
ncbi:MAG: hypothetical protein ACTHMO_03840 [Rhodanobacteraceae bacterium]